MWKSAWTCIKKALPECDRHDVSKAYVELLLVRMEAMCFRVLFSDHSYNGRLLEADMHMKTSWYMVHWSLVTLFTVSMFWTIKNRVASDQVCLDIYMSTPLYIRHDFRILIISNVNLGLPHERSTSAQAMKENCVQCRAKKADSRAMTFHGGEIHWNRQIPKGWRWMKVAGRNLPFHSFGQQNGFWCCTFDTRKGSWSYPLNVCQFFLNT